MMMLFLNYFRAWARMFEWCSTFWERAFFLVLVGESCSRKKFSFPNIAQRFRGKVFFSLWQNLNGLIAFRWLIVGVGENSIFRIAAESFAKDIHQSLFSGWKYCLDENFRIDIQMYSTFFFVLRCPPNVICLFPQKASKWALNGAKVHANTGNCQESMVQSITRNLQPFEHILHLTWPVGSLARGREKG